MLLFALPALAHGTIYATSGLVAAPDDPEELWALAGGWGLIHSTDGGDSWEWRCEEALGIDALYAVEATGPGEVVLGSSNGLSRWTNGEISVFTGLPEDGQVGGVRRFGDRLLVDLASGESADGLYVCEGEACAPTSLVTDGTYVQSIVVDTVAWVVLRQSAALRSSLWRSTDGERWSQVADWGDGGPTRTMLRADGNTLWFWAQPRDPESYPWLERSDDGGVTITTAWASPYGTTDIPGFAAVDDTLLLSNNLGYTFATADNGATWTNVSETMPLIRCAAQIGDESWICGDHFVDGFDLARLDAPDAWTAKGCMDAADVPDEACAPYHEAYIDAGLYGGGECDAAYAPPIEDTGCGCGADDSAASVLFVGAMLGTMCRRRLRRAP